MSDENLIAPAPVCAGCHQYLEDIGGKRIAFTRASGFFLRNPESPPLRKDKNFQVPLKINGKCFILQGFGIHEETFERTKEQVKQGFRPWLCQVCGNRKCENCVTPTLLPMASEIIHENGEIRHFGIFPVEITCNNPACNNYKGPQPDFKVE